MRLEPALFGRSDEPLDKLTSSSLSQSSQSDVRCGTVFGRLTSQICDDIMSCSADDRGSMTNVDLVVVSSRDEDESRVRVVIVARVVQASHDGRQNDTRMSWP